MDACFSRFRGNDPNMLARLSAVNDEIEEFFAQNVEGTPMIQDIYRQKIEKICDHIVWAQMAEKRGDTVDEAIMVDRLQRHIRSLDKWVFSRSWNEQQRQKISTQLKTSSAGLTNLQEKSLEVADKDWQELRDKYETYQIELSSLLRNYSRYKRTKKDYSRLMQLASNMMKLLHSESASHLSPPLQAQLLRDLQNDLTPVIAFVNKSTIIIELNSARKQSLNKLKFAKKELLNNSSNDVNTLVDRYLNFKKAWEAHQSLQNDCLQLRHEMENILNQLNFTIPRIEDSPDRQHLSQNFFRFHQHLLATIKHTSQQCSELLWQHLLPAADIEACYHHLFSRLAILDPSGLKTREKNRLETTPLHLAAELGYLPAVKLLIHHGANINDCSSSKPLTPEEAFRTVSRTPLMVALCCGHREIANALLTAGASTNIQKDHLWTPFPTNRGPDHLTDQEKEQRFVSGNPLRAQSIKVSKAIQECLAAKRVSQSLDLKGNIQIENIVTVRLEGCLEQWLVYEMREAFQEYMQEYPYRLNDAEALAVESLLQSGATDKLSVPDSTQLFNAIRKPDNVVQIHTGYSTHSVQAVFMKGHLMVINIGAASRRPAEIYKVDRDEVIRLTIDELKTIKHFRKEAYTTWLENFPKIAGVSSNPLTEFLEKLYPKNLPQKQSVGNCAWKSMETAIFFTLAMARFGKDPKRRVEAEVQELQSTFIQLLRFTQLHVMEKYFNQVDSGEITFSLELSTLAFQRLAEFYPWQPGMDIRVQQLEKRFQRHLYTLLWACYLDKTAIPLEQLE